MTDYRKDNPETIKAMFGSIAQNYDRTNAILSFRLNSLWNRSLIKTAQRTKPCSQILDLCCGTGEIGFGLLKRAKKSLEVFMLDFCGEMLECAKEKAQGLKLEDHQIHYLQADAQHIPLPGNSIDCVTVAYGIRNVKDPLRCAKEVFRVLRTGGTFSILELTRPENPMMRLGHAIYLKTVVPIMGKMLTSNKEAYSYLQSSIKTFIPSKDLEKILLTSGFQDVTRQSLTGGIATIISGVKA